LVFVKDTSKFTQLELRNELELEKEDGKVKGQNKDKEDLEKRLESTEKDPHFINGPYQSTESNLNFKQIFLETSWKNRSLLAASQAGLVNNLIFGVTRECIYNLFCISWNRHKRHCISKSVTPWRMKS
jgi:hypothetical protein